MANRTSVDNIQVNVSLNAERAGTSLKELKSEVRALSKELEALPAGTEEFTKKLDELAQKEKALSSVTSEVKKARDAARQDAKESQTLFQSLGESIKTGFKAMTGDAASFQTIVGSLKNGITGLAGAFLPLMAVTEIFGFIKDSVSAFNESAQAASNLENALNGNTDAIERLNTQAAELQNVTLFDDDAITAAQATLALYTDNADALEQLTPLILDYAQAKNIDLKQATEQVGKALNGEAGELKALGVVFDANATQAEKLAIIQGTLRDKVGGAAEAAAQSGTGAWTQLSNKLGNVMESVGGLVVSIGSLLVPVFNALLTVITPIIDGLSTLVGWISDAMGAVSGFVGSIGDALSYTTEEMAADYKNMTEAQRKDFEKNAAAMGANMDEIKAKVAELEAAEQAAAEATINKWGEKYATMTEGTKKFYNSMARTLGVEESVLASIEVEAETHKAAARDAARAAEEEKRAAFYEKHKAELEAQRKEMADAAFRIAELEAQTFSSELDREMALLDLKEQQDLANVKGSEQQKAAQRLLIAEIYEQERFQLEDKYRKKQLDEERALAAAESLLLDQFLSENEKAAKELERLSREDIAARKALYSKQLDELNKIQAQQREGADKVSEWSLTTESERIIAMLQQERDFLSQKLLLIEQSGLDEVAMNEEKNRAIEDSEKASAERRVQIEQDAASRRKNIMQASMQLGQALLSGIFAMEKQNQEQRKQEELANVDKVYAVRLAGAKDSAIQMAKIEKERDAARRKVEKDAFDRQKQFAEIQAIINGALAITKILAEVPKADFGIATGIMIAAAAATTAFEVATIRAQKFAKGGVVNGPLHGEGGVKLVNSRTGAIEGEMEGGEPYMILSRSTYGNNKNVIDALLHSSMYRGGAPIFENGGVFQATVPSAGAQMAAGGGDMIAELRALRQDVRMQRQMLKAYIVYQDIQDAGTELSTITQSATLS
jgi:hypothetical protein